MQPANIWQGDRHQHSVGPGSRWSGTRQQFITIIFSLSTLMREVCLPAYCVVLISFVGMHRYLGSPAKQLQQISTIPYGTLEDMFRTLVRFPDVKTLDLP